MDTKIAIKKFSSDPKVKNALDRLRTENNWVYDLFDLVDKKVNAFYNKLNLNTDKEFIFFRDSLVLTIFGTMLLKIVNEDRSAYVLNYIPRKVTKRERESAKKAGKKVLAGYTPLNFDDDWMPLVKKKVSESVDEYLRISKLFFELINKERRKSIELITPIVNELRDHKNVSLNINRLFNETNLIDASTSVKTSNTKSNRGRKFKFSKVEFLKKLNSIPKKSCKSESELAKKIGMPGSTFKDYIKRNEVDLTDILK